MSLLSDWAKESNFRFSRESRAEARKAEAMPAPNPYQPTREKQRMVGVGIDYGTFTGRGGGGARFFGEGIVRLGRTSSAARTPPFHVSAPTRDNSGTLRVFIQPGTLNGMLATNYVEAYRDGIKTGGNGFLLIDAKSDGRIITSYSLRFDEGTAAPAPVPPTTPLAPTAFTWPIAWVITAGSSRTRQLIGASSLVAVIRETSRIPKASSNPSEPGYQIFYTWIVSNSVEPTFVSLTGNVA